VKKDFKTRMQFLLITFLCHTHNYCVKWVTSDTESLYRWNCNILVHFLWTIHE